MSTHRNIAKDLRKNRTFHTYPNGGTVRSQAIEMLQNLESILANIPEGSEVPPWVVMKISQSCQSVRSVHNYISYYGSKR